MRSLDGKSYTTDAADTETMLRIVQSIPSPKAEPVKQWLARVGLFTRQMRLNECFPTLAKMTSCVWRFCAMQAVQQGCRVVQADLLIPAEETQASDNARAVFPSQ
jgi:hypothetical protein